MSFMVRHDEGFLHHNFVVALLNDLFGIQARGGCSCAGPYGHRLLGIDGTTSQKFECAILNGEEGVRPGWVRVNFNYFITEETFAFLLDAVDLVAEHGWKLLPDYVFEPATGQWRHRAGPPRPVLRLHDLQYQSGKLEYRSQRATEPESTVPTYLEEARRIFAAAEGPCERTCSEDTACSEEFEQLRWFPLPHEAAERRGPLLR